MSAGASHSAALRQTTTAAAIVIDLADALKGQVPLASLVLKAGVKRPAGEVEREAVALVRERIGRIANFKAALAVAGLPKTRSGKILRGTTRKIADGKAYPMPATIGDSTVLGLIEEALRGPGITPRAEAGFPEVTRWPPPEDQLTTGPSVPRSS